MPAIKVLRKQGRIAWAEGHRGWVPAPEDVVSALTNDGFEEYLEALGRMTGHSSARKEDGPCQ